MELITGDLIQSQGKMWFNLKLRKFLTEYGFGGAVLDVTLDVSPSP